LDISISKSVANGKKTVIFMAKCIICCTNRFYICLGGWIHGVFSQWREHRLGRVSQWGALVQSWARPGNFQPIGSLVTPFGACQPMGSSGTELG